MPEERKVRPTVIAVAHSQTEMIGNQVRRLFERNVPFFQSGLDLIKKETDPDTKARLFSEFVYRLSAFYKINSEKQNSFGIKYDEGTSDPTRIAETKKLNCLSGNFSFGCFVKALAKETGVEAIVVMKEVISTDGSDYTGHTCGQVTIKRAGELFFDITNASDEVLYFQKLDKPNAYQAGGHTYVFGANYQINDMTLHAAQIQEKLVTGQKLSKNDADFLVKMDPIFLTYLIGHIPNEEDISKIANGIERIKEPNVRLRLSLHMTEYYYEKGEVDKARKYARMAAIALNEMVKLDKTNQIKFSQYLTKAANAFGLLAEEKKTETITLYRMMLVAIINGETGELRADAKFFETLNDAMEKRVAGYRIRFDKKAGVKDALLESMAIAKLLRMIQDTDFARTNSGRAIVSKLEARIQNNCRELGLDYGSLTKATTALEINTGYTADQKAKYEILILKLDRIRSVVKGDTEMVAKLRMLYSGDKKEFAELNKWFEKVRPLS